MALKATFNSRPAALDTAGQDGQLGGVPIMALLAPFKRPFGPRGNRAR